MASGIFRSPLVGAVNSGAMRLLDVPGLGALLRRNMVAVRYSGRRSGQTFQTPVNYRRDGDDLVIRVMTPDSKTWWRNFTGEGGSITLVGLDGADRTGHAVAHRDDRGRVTVRVRLGAG